MSKSELEIKDIKELRETIRKIINRDLHIKIRTRKLPILEISIKFGGVWCLTKEQILRFQLNEVDNSCDYFLEETLHYAYGEVKDKLSHEVWERNMKKRELNQRQNVLVTKLLHTVANNLDSQLFPEDSETLELLDKIKTGDKHSVKVMEV